MMSLPLLFLAAYFILVVLCARVFSRRVEGLKDYFLAGRSLGPLPVALTFAASWFGAASTMGSINAFHDVGLSGIWQMVIPSVLSFLVITFWMAKAVARQDVLSMPEAVERHYGRTGRLILAVTILASVTTLLGSQLVAAGKVFENVFGLDITMATVAVSLIVVAYTMLGGYFAVVVTDILQMAFITVGFVILLAFTASWAIPDMGHWQAFVATRPTGFWDGVSHWPAHLALVFTFVLAWSIAPEMWQRMSSARSPALAKKAGLWAIGLMAFLYSVVTAIGLLSSSVIGKSDAVLVDLALKIPNPALSCLVLLAFVAAVTSTMDSVINVGSLTLARDIYQGFLRQAATTAEVLWVSRIATVLIVMPAIVVALAYQDIIRILWVSADIYASTMFFPVMAILHLKNPGRTSGVLAMVFGGICVLVSMGVQNHILAMAWPDWPYSTLLSVGASGLGFVLGLAWDAHGARRSATLINTWVAQEMAAKRVQNPFASASLTPSAAIEEALQPE